MMPLIEFVMEFCEYSSGVPQPRRSGRPITLEPTGNSGNNDVGPMKTLKDMLTEARQVVPEEGPAEVARRLSAGEKLVVIDVRDPDEFRDGHLEAATNISRGFLEFRVGTAVSDPSTPIVLYCQTGLRSMLAAKALKELGYPTVINLQGGYQKWVQSGLATVREVPLTA